MVSLENDRNGRGFTPKWAWLQKFCARFAHNWTITTPLQEILDPPLLIVSVYACMHCVWEIIVCRHSGDAGLCVYVACMDGLAQLVGI